MNKRVLALVLCLLLTVGISQAFPLVPVRFYYNDVLLTTTGDEHGTVTRDAQGRVAKQDGSVWYYATLSSSFQSDPYPVLVKSVEVSLSGIAPELAAYSDPVIDRRVRAFNAQATDIVSVLGDVAITIILVVTDWPNNPAEPENFWEWNGHMLDPQQVNDMIMLENYAQTYPNYVNQGGYEIPGSANDWWLRSSRGQSRLVPDESRYPAGYVAERPGWILDPATGLPFVLDFGLIENASVFWDMLAEAGIDTELDSRRPIVFLAHGQGGSRAHYGGYTILNMEQYSDSPLTIGVLLHEFAHCVLQCPDLYWDTENNAFQLMSLGGHGYYDTEAQRHNLGYPSDLEPAFKELIGWLEPTYITDPGDYPLNSDSLTYCWVNPNNPDEKYYINTWNKEEGFMVLHDPLGEGSFIVQHSSLNKPGWRFLNKPCPELIFASLPPGDWVEAWPYGEHVVLDVERWENGTWFGWTVNTANGSGELETLSFRLEERPMATACVVMVHDPLMDEVPIGGVEANFNFVNLGPTFVGWSMSIGNETVSSQDTVSFNQTFQASFSSEIWEADNLGQDLDLLVQLQLSSLDTSIIVERLQPFVGLRPSNWTVSITSEGLIETYREHLIKIEGSNITIYTNGQQGASLGFVSDIKALCFAGDEDDHFAVIGDDWVALCRVQNNSFVFIAQPVNNQPVDAYMLSNTPEFGWCLVIASNNHLIANRLNNGEEAFNFTLPDYVVPANDLAYAGNDPVGDTALGSRFCLVGGLGNNWVYLTNVAGTSLYSRTAGDCGMIKNPLSLDLLGNGYYGFVVSVLTCVNNFGGFDEELWHISYSSDQGHHGVGILDLGNYQPGFENGIEILVPYHNTDFPAREALVANDYFPYSNTQTDINLYDLGHNDVEIRVLESVPPLRRGFKVGNLNADLIHDILVWDRGEGLRYWQGLGDLDFSDQGTVHNYSDANRSPVVYQNDGDLQLGFYEEAGQLIFYDWPLSGEWLAWYRSGGVGNQRHMPNENWTAPTGPLNPPDISITRLGNGDMRLDIESISYGQQCASYQVWFSTDQENWVRLAEVLWDGQLGTSWVHHRALYGNPIGMYRVNVEANPDGGAVWSE